MYLQFEWCKDRGVTEEAFKIMISERLINVYLCRKRHIKKKAVVG
jgi:hypothetical protein